MTIRTLALLSAATLTLAACGSKTETTSADNAAIAATETQSTTNAVAPAATPAASGGQAFANAAAASDAFEIATSRLATTNGASAPVRKYADQMIAAHTASTAKLKAATAGVSPAIVPNPALNAEQEAKLADLRLKTGEAFDAAYVTEQRAAHQQTLDTLNAYAASGDVPALKTFASGLAPTVAAHLNMAKALRP